MIARISQEEVFLLRVRKDVASLLGSPPRTAPSPSRGGQDGRAVFSALPAWAAEVVSSNIVGYQKVTLQPGFNFVAPQFTAVGGGAIDLQSIKLDVADEDASGNDNIQILDEGGATLATYFWYPADWFGGEHSGWIDGDTGELVEESLANGLSVLVDSADTATVTIAGEVSPDNTTVVSVAGFNFVGNSTPVEIDIQDIQIDVADEDASGNDNIQILDEGGATLATYFWYPADWFGGERSGWIDGDTGELAEVSLAPGQGVLLDASENGINITVPSAL